MHSSAIAAIAATIVDFKFVGYFLARQYRPDCLSYRDPKVVEGQGPNLAWLASQLISSLAFLIFSFNLLINILPGWQAD